MSSTQDALVVLPVPFLSRYGDSRSSALPSLVKPL